MASDWGLLIVRVVVGFFLFGHGTQKLFGWFGGSGLPATLTMLGQQLRLRPAAVWAVIAGLTEAGGGLLFGLGLLSPLGAIAISAAMLVACAAHWGRLWAMNRGIEPPLTNLAIAAAVGLIGPGAYSLDTVLRIALPMPVSFEIGFVLALLGSALALLTRAPRPATPEAQPTKTVAASRT
jgi:putative oxidoreductase